MEPAITSAAEAIAPVSRSMSRLKRRPSEVFQQQVWVTFQEEHVGLKLLPELGLDRVMWASDFPHPDGTFPHSRKVIAETLGEFDEITRRKLVHDTAARLYGMG